MTSVVAAVPVLPLATALVVRRWDALADSQASQKAGAGENLRWGRGAAAADSAPGSVAEAVSVNPRP